MNEPPDRLSISLTNERPDVPFDPAGVKRKRERWRRDSFISVLTLRTPEFTICPSFRSHYRAVRLA